MRAGREAFSRAFSKLIEEIERKLKIYDKMERKLFAVKSGPNPPQTGSVVFSIFLLKPGPATQKARTIVLELGEKRRIRFTRALGDVKRPLASMCHTWAENGEIMHFEQFLEYGTDGEWKQFQPEVRTVELDKDPEAPKK